MDLSKEIRKYLIAVRKDITAQIDKHDFIASGRMRRNTRVVANQYLAGEVRGVYYMNFLQEGTSKPKKVSKGFVDNIIDWIGYKGIALKRTRKDGSTYIVPNTKSNIKRSAFGIAQGIVDKGTPATRREKNIDIIGAMNRHKNDYLEAIGKEFLLTFEDKLKIK